MVDYFVKLMSNTLSNTEKLFFISLVLTSGTLFNRELPIAAILMLLSFILLLNKKEIVLNKRCSSLIVCIAFYSCIWLIQNYIYGPFQIFNVIKYCCVLFMPIIVAYANKDKNEFYLRYIFRVILVFSFISNILFFINLLGFSLPSIPTSNPEKRTVFYIESFSESTHYGVGGFRNSGIYWEPGMYQIYMNLLLCFYLYSKEYKHRILIICYLIVSIITTGSVSGYLLCGLILGIYSLSNNSTFVLKLLIIGICAIAIILAIPYMVSMIETKMTVGESYSLRMTDLIDGFGIFLTKPFWGYGIVNEAYLNYSLAEYGLERGDSNGMINLLIDFGVLGCSICVILMCRFFRWITNNIEFKLALPLFAWLLISINTEPMTLHPFFFYLLGIGVSQTN